MRLVIVPPLARPAEAAVLRAPLDGQERLRVRRGCAVPAALHVVALRVHADQRLELVVAQREAVRLRARVRQQRLLVELLCQPHRLLGAEAQVPRRQLLQLDCRQRQRLPLRLPLPPHARHRALRVRHAVLVQNHRRPVVELALALPLELHRRLVALLVRHVDPPEPLRPEPLTLPVPRHDEAEGGRLAAAVRHLVGQAREAVAEQQRLEARERVADADVQDLPCVHRVRRSLVWRAQRRQRPHEVRLRHGGEACAQHLQAGVHLQAHLDHLVADVLALSVAVEPAHQVRCHPCLGHQVVPHLLHPFADLLRQRRREQTLRVVRTPLACVHPEREAHHVPDHARHKHLHRRTPHLVAKLPHRVRTRPPGTLRRLGPAQRLRQPQRHAGLLSHIKVYWRHRRQPGVRGRGECGAANEVQIL
eukprot:Rhum_TRINITY_DN13374_c1_g1::Rhum_TRINITY_DN13374_c1_g1_i1::g.59600::m.59600